MVYFYSKKPNNKATARHIKYFILQALEHREWVQSVIKNPAKHCDLNLQTAQRDKLKSIKQLAHEKLEYTRHRAFLSGAYGGTWPLDKPARDLWEALA